MITIISLATRQLYDIPANEHGENQMPCPECSQNRRKKTAKSFSYNAEKGTGYCNHCEAKFVKHEPFEQKQYTKPKIQWENYTKLSENVVKWFEGRGISQRTLLAAKIGEKKEWLPQIEKEANCITFPFFRTGELINMKFRDGRKNFKLVAGAELIWYNFDAITRCIESGEPLIICEGEIDALSFMQAGLENVVSVPNGASTGRMEYFDSSFELLNKVKSFIIATDNDLKGLDLRNDLVRRLGMEKCRITSFKQYKDANEVLKNEGAESLKKFVESAKLVKLPDIYEIDDIQADLDAYFEDGLPQGKRINVPALDEIIRWQTGRFGVATGIPGSGKSEFMDFIYSKLNILYGWPLGYYSPESMPIPSHFARVFPKFVGKEYKKGVITNAERETGEEYLRSNIFWVAPTEDISLDDILTRFEYLAKAKGCKAFIIDPFNRIMKGANDDKIELSYIRNALVKMSSFARRTDSLLFLIAHPTKMPTDNNGNFKMPTPYNIAGSADFWNVPDYCIGVRREQDENTKKFQLFGQVNVSKTKINKTLGDTGTWNFRYNINNGRYEWDDVDTPASTVYDNSNWITKEEYKAPEVIPLPQVSPQEAFEFPEIDDSEMPF